ncbi:hypothetical protein WME79_04895 [Sorangium sp. So ce726]|uniref:hypothetical protein n=1 Tax=Sorangium sp. So ce726 TaxID=3133319 RepID=UPI003F5E25D8
MARSAGERTKRESAATRGATSGALELGAEGELAAGTTFKRELVSRSGDLLRFVGIGATVASGP